MSAAAGGYRSASQLPAPGLTTTILITFFFGLFGLIPAAIDAGRARDHGHPSGRYWGAFVITQGITALAGVLIAVMLYGSLFAAFLGLSRLQGPSGTDAAPTSYSTTGPYEDESTVYPTQDETTAAEPTPTEDPQDAARIRLGELADAGAVSLVTDGHWVVQLASKWPGITDPLGTTASGSHRFKATDVLAEHEALRSQFGDDVILIRSTDMGKQLNYSKMPDGETLWVTLYDPGTFSSRAAAQKWCNKSFADLDATERENACYVRQATYPHS